MEHPTPSGAVPLDLIAGMKHSGKTSLINALVQGPYRGQNVSVFTNELGNADYAQGVRVHQVLGGCICCTAQAALIAEIRNALWFEAPDRLIVELSGKAAIRDMLTIFSFLPDCRLHQLVYVLNARKFRAMATVMGSGFSGEIQASPVVLLNRWQELGPEEQEAVRAQLQSWNPGARLLTDFSEVDPEENCALCRGLQPAGPEPVEGGLPHTAFRSRASAGGDAGMRQLLREKAARRLQ